jgi:hypothetical protein
MEDYDGWTMVGTWEPCKLRVAMQRAGYVYQWMAAIQVELQQGVGDRRMER